MVVIGTQTPEQAQKPTGFIIPNYPSYKLESETKYNPYTRCWESSDEVKENKNFYQIDGKEFFRPYIKNGFCRSCQKEIKPYKTIFYKKVFEYANWNSWLYSANNGYCEACAIKETKDVLSEENPLFVTKEIHETWGFTSPYTVDRLEYSDGSVVESDTRDPLQNNLRGKL